MYPKLQIATVYPAEWFRSLASKQKSSRTRSVQQEFRYVTRRYKVTSPCERCSEFWDTLKARKISVQDDYFVFNRTEVLTTALIRIQVL